MIDDEAVKSIENLHRLKAEGIITPDEFERSKERVLFGPKPAPGSGIVRTGPVPMPAEDDHLGWITLPLKRYADFTGRSSRREFWMFQLLYVAIAIATVTIMTVDTNSYGETGLLTKLTLVSAILAALGLAVPLLAVEARRFHDQDKSAWLVLINLVPYVGFVIVAIMMTAEGTKGDNRYGADPLAR